jgi:hypothetical protein
MAGAYAGFIGTAYDFGSMPSWLSGLLSNATFAALAGFIVGGVVSYIAGAGIARRDRRHTHRAAVRAVVYELTENIPKVDNPVAPGQLSTSTFDALVVPLYTDLPDAIAHHVSLAYALLHISGPSIAAMPPGNQGQVRDAVHAAQEGLRKYAKEKLKMNFDPPGG